MRLTLSPAINHLLLIVSVRITTAVSNSPVRLSKSGKISLERQVDAEFMLANKALVNHLPTINSNSNNNSNNIINNNVIILAKQATVSRPNEYQIIAFGATNENFTICRISNEQVNKINIPQWKINGASTIKHPSSLS